MGIEMTIPDRVYTGSCRRRPGVGGGRDFTGGLDAHAARGRLHRDAGGSGACGGGATDPSHSRLGPLNHGHIQL